MTRDRIHLDTGLCASWLIFSLFSGDDRVSFSAFVVVLLLCLLCGDSVLLTSTTLFFMLYFKRLWFLLPRSSSYVTLLALR